MDYQFPIPETQGPITKNVELSQKWITARRPPPDLQLFAEEIILEVAHWCLDPASLLNLSSTCRNFAAFLRVSRVWLAHHWDRGYDIGVLAKKAACAASADEPEFGRDGWGILVKSAFDKAEFPDDEHETQWNMGKPLPHMKTVEQFDADAIEKYQPRGEKWMQVFYDILTEHERWNLELYPYLHDEALSIRVKKRESRYLQALICSCELLIRMYMVPIAVLNTNSSIFYSLVSLYELNKGMGPVEPASSWNSLTKTFLIAKKIMEIQPVTQDVRRLYPHPPFGPSIWEKPTEGKLVPKDGFGWTPKVMDDWKGRVYVVGQFTTNCIDPKRPYEKLELGRSIFRMCLDFEGGTVTGRGGDFGGKFRIESGSYKKTFVKFVKNYEGDDEEEPDAYEAQGHMTPWGVYGTWKTVDDHKEVRGYWVMWRFEGAPKIQYNAVRENGKPMFKQEPYKADARWFEEYEMRRDSGQATERVPIPEPPEAEDVPLPEIDAFGL